MRMKHPYMNGPSLRESGLSLKADLVDSKTRILADARNLARAAKNEVKYAVTSAPFLTGIAAFFIGGFFGWMMKGRKASS